MLFIIDFQISQPFSLNRSKGLEYRKVSTLLIKLKKAHF